MDLGIRGIANLNRVILQYVGISNSRSFSFLGMLQSRRIVRSFPFAFGLVSRAIL
jgi:hypothetical protein